MSLALYLVATLLVIVALGVLLLGEGARPARGRGLALLVIAAVVFVPIATALPELAYRLRDRLIDPGASESTLVVVATWGPLAKQLALTIALCALGIVVVLARRELPRIVTGFGLVISGALLSCLAFALDRAAVHDAAEPAEELGGEVAASIGVLPWVAGGGSLLLVLAYVLLSSKLAQRLQTDFATSSIESLDLMHHERP